MFDRPTGSGSATSDTAAVTSTARYRAAEAALGGTTGARRANDGLSCASSGSAFACRSSATTGTAVPMVFVHGGPNAGSTFAPLAAAMKGRRVVILDRPGSGLSGPADYDATPVPQLATSVVDATLDELGVERADVVGSSFGGAWALWFALARPERVNRLVLLGAPAFVRTWPCRPSCG